MNRQHINPKKLPDWSNMFSQVVLTEHNGLKFVHISGQVGVNQEKNLVGDGSLNAQTRQALANLQVALDSVGASIGDVVKLTIYVVDYQYAQAAVIREALQAVFPPGQLPALSLLGVAALADKQFLIEINAEVYCALYHFVHGLRPNSLTISAQHDNECCLSGGV